MLPEVQTEYPALSGRKNAISFRKLVESSGLYEKRSLCPDFIATFVAGLLEENAIEVKISGREVQLDFKPFQIQTHRITSSSHS